MDKRLRKKLKKILKTRKPIAPPMIVHLSKKSYDRKKLKLELKHLN